MSDPFDVLAPWDAARYFQPLIEQTFVIPGATVVQIVTADPQTVCLVFSSLATAQMLISTTPFPSGGGMMMGANGGISMVSGQSLEYFWGRHGPLVQADWWATTAAGGSITVQIVKLATWPGEQRRARSKRNPATP